MTSLRCRRLPALFLSAFLATSVWAQESPPPEAPAAAPAPAPAPVGDQPEEIVVTGSYIKGTPEDASLPVDVTSLEDLQAAGSPNVVELIRNLAYTSGNLAETNQFGAGGGGIGQAQEGVVTLNLRGLGSARTLVLLNGRRHVPSDLVGVDLSAIPKGAIGRLEVLKDGAAALYGSDAIGGVANFITREGFEGIELSASEQFIDKSNGDHEVSALGGWAGERINLIGAFEWSHRSELGFRERDWGLRPQPVNPQGGWSGIGNPARFIPAHPLAASALNPIGALGAGGPDPNCELLGGAVVPPACQFQYTYFDNITEDQDTYKVYVETNIDLPNEAELHLEGLWGSMNMPEWKTSPSYPPQSLFGPDRLIAPTHPGLIDFKAQNPALFPTVGPFTAASQYAWVLNRSLGVAGFFGESQTGSRETDQWRMSARLTGNFFDAVDYEFALTYGSRDRRLNGYDMYVERMAFGLDGLGGPDCDPATGTPGVGGCEYYNPFSNAIERSAVNGATNPQFNPAVANSEDLIRWLYGKQASRTHNDLLVWDAILSGLTPWNLPGGEIGWAFGFQARREKFFFHVNDLTNLEVSPCPFNNQASVTLGNISQVNFDACQNGETTATGPLAFLAGTYEEDQERTIYGFFGEVSLPIFDTVDAQVALRFEDYGGSVGSTVDPKFALSWQAMEWLKLRGSVSTTFRGPPQSFLGGRGTALAFIPAAFAFKAIDTLGNPDLKPETALTSNLGLILEWEGLYASLDYWRFKFEDPFQVESFGQIVNRYSAPSAANPGGLACFDGGAGVGTPDCDALRAHIFPTGVLPAALERVEVSWINGSEINTSGLDFYIQYDLDLFDGTFTLGSSGSYRLEYDSKDFVDINGVFLAEGGDFNGFLNDTSTPFTPLPDLKTDTFLKYTRDFFTGSVVGRYVTGYKDLVPPRDALGNVINNLDKIDNHFVVDMHFVFRLFEESTALSFSIQNLTDEDPPLAATDLNYDPFTHDARGRIYKLGLTYTWSPQ